jgi:glycosyltransferase involved in cell wall biosynthesis
MPIVECPWIQSAEAQEVANADIGISWIPNDPWSQGKCGLKVLQYMAAGLPVVANPVGVHTEMIRHGESGFLASTSDEWVCAIQTLSRDPDLRRRFGQLGRKIVSERYSIEVGANRWLQILNELASQRASA